MTSTATAATARTPLLGQPVGGRAKAWRDAMPFETAAIVDRRKRQIFDRGLQFRMRLRAVVLEDDHAREARRERHTADIFAFDGCERSQTGRGITGRESAIVVGEFGDGSLNAVGTRHTF